MPNLELELEELEEPLGEYEEEAESWEAEGAQFDGLEELEGVGELEDESEEFLGDVLRKAVPILTRAASGGIAGLLPNLAQQAARVAGAAVAGRPGAAVATQVARRCLRETEFEVGYEAEPLLEEEGIDHEALDEAEFYAAQAAEAESAAEAEQFLGAIAPIISQIAGPLLGGLFGGDDGEQEGEPFLGDIVDAVGGLLGEEEGYGEEEGERFLPFLAALAPMVLPLVKKGISAVGKLVSKKKATRPAMRALPRIAAKTISSLAKQARGGRRVTPRGVAATLAQHTARTLGNRKRLGQTIRMNRKGAARAQARPLIGPGGYWGPGMDPNRPGYPRPGVRPGVPSPRPTARPGGRPGGGPPSRGGMVIGYIPVLAARRRMGRPRPTPVYR